MPRGARSFLPVSPWISALLLGSLALAAPPEATPVTLNSGETLLSDVGNYRVGWQSYGQEAVWLPVGWTGRQDERSGVMYESGVWVQGRAAIFMHNPWRVPAGKAWVEYPITLPAVTPIELSFGFAISSDAAAPNHSDGVTFSCTIVADGTEHELVRTHYTKATWCDQRFDLDAYAGKSIVVRFQVEPGPANNSSFDHSYFSEPKLVIGSGTPDHTQLLQQITASHAYQATASANLAALSNNPTNGIVPSNLLPCKNELKAVGDAWQFHYQGEDCRVVYTYRPQTGTLDDFTVQVDDGAVLVPMANGGVTAVTTEDASREVTLRGGKAVRVAAEGDVLHVRWQYDLSGTPVEIDWQFQLLGKSLVIDARCEQPVVRQFSLGNLGPVAMRRRVSMPYLWGNLAYLPSERLYVNRYLDWDVSQASHCPQGEASYNQKTDKTRNLLVERGYVAVSPELGEVLPNLPSPPSPYLDTLGPRIMLDIWHHAQGTYQGDAENLRALKDHGVDHLAIIQHVWQRYGYDVKLPDHLPADPQFGGDEGMVAFGQAARDYGYLWSLHENYIDLYPDAPSYDPAARAQNPDGTPCLGWFNGGTQVQSYGLKCTRGLDFARQNAPEAHRRYGTTAAYLDVHTCVPPWQTLDHEAGQPLAAMAKARWKYDTELFQYMRNTHGGPLFGEGANQFYWAGRCDGVEAQVPAGEDHTPLVDFDLLKIHPQMVNHGMGYYERWFRRGYSHRFGVDTGTMEQIDQYRAMELAYGHAGFIGDAQTDNLQWVIREHHLTHPVQRLYGTARPVEIRYEVGGQFVTASAAVAVNDTWRQRIRYDSGLTLWINGRAEPWTVEGHTLPQWGFLALGPQTHVDTALHGERVADYAECPDYVFADARTSFSMPYRNDNKKIEPRLREFKYLGDDRIQVTYDWLVNDTIKDDLTCFVHGVNEAETQHQGILFQQDHGLPKPTSQWRPGEVIVDGPYEIRVPAKADHYYLMIGLYGNSRALLQGLCDKDSRVVLARLDLKRENDKIVAITSQPPKAEDFPPSQLVADFSVRLNPAGTWIDFGPLATDGSAKVNREADRLVVFPYPREKSFRVCLDLKMLAPTADPARVEVHALAAGTQEDRGAVPFQRDGTKLTLPVGGAGIGRYVITWK